MFSLPNWSLRDKVVIQFGGTGVLGRALISSISASGANLIVASRNREGLDALAVTEREAGHSIEVDTVDVGSEASLLALRDNVLGRQHAD